MVGGTGLHLRTIGKTCTRPAGQPLVPFIRTLSHLVPRPHELATAAGTRAAGGQGKPGRAGYWQTAGLRDVSQMEMQPKTRAVKLQGKPLPSPQKETGYAKVTKMTKNNEVSQGIWLLFFLF